MIDAFRCEGEGEREESHGLANLDAREGDRGRGGLGACLTVPVEDVEGVDRHCRSSAVGGLGGGRSRGEVVLAVGAFDWGFLLSIAGSQGGRVRYPYPPLQGHGACSEWGGGVGLGVGCATERGTGTTSGSQWLLNEGLLHYRRAEATRDEAVLTVHRPVIGEQLPSHPTSRCAPLAALHDELWRQRSPLTSPKN